MKKKSTRKKKKSTKAAISISGPPVGQHVEHTIIDDSFRLDSPRAILDEGLSDSARLLVDVANGRVEVSREQLAAAQDILNRNGITAGGGGRTSAFPEAFARDAFSTVFRLLGFAPIKWPSTGLKSAVQSEETELQETDAFHAALQET